MKRRLAAALVAGTCLLLASCASATTPSPGAAPASAPDQGLGAVSPGLPDGEVRGQGTVLDDGTSAKLCLSAVAESAPPQCSGIPLVGWTWDGVDGKETMSGTTWGAYAVQGTYDGESFTVTQPPIMLALYDPIPLPDPTGGRAGTATDAEISEMQDALPERLGDAFLGSSAENGWLWADVLWDDGTWQDAADGEFGASKVVIRSALRSLDG